MNEPLIEVQQLFKTFGNGAKRVDVLKGIDLLVSKRRDGGDRRCLRGREDHLPSRAGNAGPPHLRKSALRGPGHLHAGERALALFRNRQIGFVFQFHHLLPEFSALENVMMPCLIQGISQSEAGQRAESILTLVGLRERLIHKPGELSGGEQQRVAVARAMVLEPKVLLADEPTGNLDTKTGESVFDLLDELNRTKGVTLIIVTHNPALAGRMSHQIHLVDGRIQT